VNKQHPKTLRPLRLILESLAVGIAASALCFAMPLWQHGSFALDVQWLGVTVIVGVASTGAYFAAPYMGYNFLWNTRIFDGAAMWLALAAAMTSLFMGLQPYFPS
jgi:hypothetical protein